MKKILATTIALLAISFCQAQSSVKGYTRKDGTYVPSHERSRKNETNHDNFTTKDNVNPYNGKEGGRAKDYTPDANKYGDGRAIQTGPKGGQYYINDQGKKVYVPKR